MVKLYLKEIKIVLSHHSQRCEGKEWHVKLSDQKVKFLLYLFGKNMLLHLLESKIVEYLRLIVLHAVLNLN